MAWNRVTRSAGFEDEDLVNPTSLWKSKLGAMTVS